MQKLGRGLSNGHLLALAMPVLRVRRHGQSSRVLGQLVVSSTTHRISSRDHVSQLQFAHDYVSTDLEKGFQLATAPSAMGRAVRYYSVA